MRMKKNEVYKNNSGDNFIIVKDNGCNEVYGFYEENPDFILSYPRSDIKRGSIKNKNKKVVHGIGCLGYGDYVAKTNGVTQKSYDVWTAMLNRISNREEYKDVKISDMFSNYQSFACWFENNYIEGNVLDKDLLNQYGEKIYSEHSCTFIDKYLNSKIVSFDKIEINEVNKNKKLFKSRITFLSERIEKRFNTKQEALEWVINIKIEEIHIMKKLYSLNYLQVAGLYDMIGKIINKNIKLGLYHLNQDEKTEYIKRFLTLQNIPFEELSGNIYSIRNFGEPIFVAHLDGIDEDISSKKKIIFKKDSISREEGTLQADDNAGINLILNHCKDINFAFFHSEEIGGIGSTEMSNDVAFMDLIELMEIPCMIELDRMGGTDIIGDIHGYCASDLVKEIIKNLPKYKESYGIFTDIDAFVDVIPGVNLSVGYYNQHSSNEFLCISEFEYIDSKIIDMAKNITGKFNLGRLGTYVPTPYSDNLFMGNRLTDIQKSQLSCIGNCDTCYYEWDCKLINTESSMSDNWIDDSRRIHEIDDDFFIMTKKPIY